MKIQKNVHFIVDLIIDFCHFLSIVCASECWNDDRGQNRIRSSVSHDVRRIDSWQRYSGANISAGTIIAINFQQWQRLTNNMFSPWKSIAIGNMSTQGWDNCVLGTGSKVTNSKYSSLPPHFLVYRFLFSLFVFVVAVVLCFGQI